MVDSIRGTCLLDRYWNPATKQFDGIWQSGNLIDISVQTRQGNQDQIAPVGIVLLDDNTFQCVPVEFIQKEQA